MGEAVRSRATSCRSVTDEEVEHYHELGWVLLRQFVDPELVGTMLGMAREQMGEDADSNPLHPQVEDAVAEGGAGIGYFNAHRTGGLGDPVLGPLLHEVGANAEMLLARRRPDGSPVGIRYYSDHFVPKLPSSRPARHGGNGPTAYHQDFITFAVDRTGGMTFWFPLEAYGGDAGTMSFVNRSHRAGVMGDYTTYGDGDALDAFPEMHDLGLTEPITYEVGDITVHSHLTVHGAGENRMDHPRWAYFVVVQPEDACWNGSPCPNFRWQSMTQWEPFGGQRFPVIS